MKKALTGILTICLALIMNGCSNQASSEEGDGKPLIKIGYMPITHAVPLFMQEDMLESTNADYNIELVRFSSWPDLMDALNTGRIDGASTLITVAMKANELGIDLRGVALGHREGNVLMGAKDINEISDLKGETFAIPHKISTHNVLLYLMLKEEGIDYEDINTVEMPPAEMPAALAEGRIKGYVVAEPFGAQSVVMDSGKVLYQSDHLWENSLDCAIVLHGDFIKNNRGLAQDFMSDYLKAAAQSDEKDEHVHQVSSEFMQVDEEVMDLSMDWISYDELKIDEDSYNDLRVYMQEMGLSENPPTYEEFVDVSLWDEVG
ncbi:ABC transporter substrate-binding protein [Salinicoccus halitifaciens]|uniref:NitT/TauT family transport system substrate-binding protein n=1 Tax=Salinicoccus halitifaciens TaxID=1073415 RepID=A0ABV2EC54_9STAP|nr:ABC transporter substrate-binding protein [Salinicoccus halitifaciens]MCD2138480.1 ABC transporter substrate-binding protein [Salinicoccus halitifaciens]